MINTIIVPPQITDVCQEHEKDWKLVKLMQEIMQEQENKTLIFCETKRRVIRYGGGDVAVVLNEFCCVPP